MFMEKTVFRKALSALMSIVLISALSLPATALAAQPEVQVDNHAAANGKVVSGIVIDGVDAPVVGDALDGDAVVSTAEGEMWDIPVLWVDTNLQLTTVATEGSACLPALAFFVPEGLSVDGASFTVTLSDALTKLFGDEDAISVFDADTGITYILPASIRDFFKTAREGALEPADGEWEFYGEEGLGDGDESAALSLVDVYCAKTARDALTDADLEYLIDLVRKTLQPQAVELLRNSFPAFRAAASKGQIGKEIGLYIYYQEGDKDGKQEHQSASSALAYVSADVANVNGKLKYCYLLALDVSSLVKKDDKGQPVRDEKTGKYVLLKEGYPVTTLNNTVVHEMFHAFMDDYNRTGMLGSKTIKDGYTPGGQFADERQKELFNALHYPRWFIEGTASAVENVYQFRHSLFKMFRAAPQSDSVFENTYTTQGILNNYLNAKQGGQYVYFELPYAQSTEVDTTASRYVTGYLATVFLSQLAAQKDPKIGSAVNEGVFDSQKLRLGLNSILQRMHNGQTLDQVIKDISTIGKDAPLYTSTKDFEAKFIMGVEGSDKLFHGDNASLAFTRDFLNYMLSLENNDDFKNWPNGSILFDFAKDFEIPLDPTKKTTSNLFVIIDSNEFVPSTVKDSIAFHGGGKSAPPATVKAAASAASESATELPLAAKDDAETVPESERASGPDAPAVSEAEGAFPTEAAPTAPELPSAVEQTAPAADVAIENESAIEEAA